MLSYVTFPKAILSELLGDGKAHKMFQHKLFGPHPNRPISGPQKKSVCASFPCEKGTHINFFKGILGVKKAQKKFGWAGKFVPEGNSDFLEESVSVIGKAIAPRIYV